MFEQFQDLDLFPVNVFDVFGNLLVALVCSLIIAMVYRFIYKGSSYSVTYVNSLVLLTLVTSVVMLVIGNNLARAFGLVGAMSIIRFRTAVRDVQDIVFIFFALAVGMASGVGLHVIAIASTIIISFVATVLITFNFGNPRKTEYLMQLTYVSTPESDRELNAFLRKYCRRFKLVNIKNREEDDVEAFYQVAYKSRKNSAEVLRELRKVNSVKNVNLFFDEDDSDPSFN
jgi:uncharacterized membrane protein YhiD involved in acid resistance